jgi:hypothetical protein
MSEDKSNGAGDARSLWDREEIETASSRPFIIETASGRRFIVHAASEEAALASFKASVADGAVAFYKGYKPLGEFGAVVSVRPEPAVKVTLQEGPMERDKR